MCKFHKKPVNNSPIWRLVLRKVTIDPNDGVQTRLLRFAMKHHSKFAIFNLLALGLAAFPFTGQ
jgi:hypothetical protein